MEVKAIERGKKKKEKDRRKYRQQSIYAELEITKVSDGLQLTKRFLSCF